MTDCRKCELNNNCPGFTECPKMTTTTNLIELRNLAEAATPGKWVFSKDRDTHDCPIHIDAPPAPDSPTYTCDYYHQENGGVVGSSEWIWLKDHDGAYIAAAHPRAVIELLDTIEAQGKQIEHWKTARESAMFAGEQMLDKLKEQAKQIFDLQKEQDENAQRYLEQIEALQADADRMPKVIVSLQFQLQSASNYIDVLGGVSKNYRQSLQTSIDAAARKGNV